MQRRFTDVGHPSIGPPLAWSIGVAAVASVFAFVAIIANYASLNRAKEDRIIQIELPAARFDSIGDLIRVSGQICPRVCAIGAAPAASGARVLDVECTSQVQPADCATPVHYRIAVAATN